MDNILNILNMINQKAPEPPKQEIPKEVLDQYPYGDFPIRYTKHGQENIRKNSENRFSYSEEPNKLDQPNNFDFSSILPFIQLLSNKNQPKDMMKLISKLLFKDNKDLQKIFEMFPMKNKEIIKNDNFPDTNKVNISSLKRIN